MAALISRRTTEGECRASLGCCLGWRRPTATVGARWSRPPSSWCPTSQHLAEVPRSTDPLTPDIMHQAYQVLVQSFDYDNGGFGGAPKFPQPMIYEFVLRYYHLTKSERALEMVESTLEKMATGGIYDHIGGGFHRYATDSYWLVPHFEKMLYDNALLSRLYLHAYQATGNPLYRRVAEETLDYVLREMTDPSGGFYSTQDADSEGEEGKFFLWTPDEVEQVLGPEAGSLVGGYFDVTEAGNFEGKSILNVPQSAEAYSAQAGVSPQQLEEAVARARPLLLQARETRMHPGRDEKILSAWNGLMTRSFAEAASILRREDYRRAAVANASFLLESLQEDGRLLRTYKDGRASLKGYLEDYAFAADGLLALYEATFDRRWLEEARLPGRQDGRAVLGRRPGGFLRHRQRPRRTGDPGPETSSTTLRPAAARWPWTYRFTSPCSPVRPTTPGGPHPRCARCSSTCPRPPLGMGHWLCALDFYATTTKEVAIVGDPADPATQALLEVVHAGYLPNKVVAGKEPNGRSADEIPLLQGRGMVEDRPTAYVCQNYVCQLPVTDPEALAGQLAS